MLFFGSAQVPNAFKHLVKSICSTALQVGFSRRAINRNFIRSIHF